MGAFTRNDRDEIKADMEKMFKLFPRLAERKKTTCWNDEWRRTTNASNGKSLDV